QFLFFGHPPSGHAPPARSTRVLVSLRVPCLDTFLALRLGLTPALPPGECLISVPRICSLPRLYQPQLHSSRSEAKPLMWRTPIALSFAVVQRLRGVLRR